MNIEPTPGRANEFVESGDLDGLLAYLGSRMADMDVRGYDPAEVAHGIVSLVRGSRGQPVVALSFYREDIDRHIHHADMSHTFDTSDVDGVVVLLVDDEPAMDIDHPALSSRHNGQYEPMDEDEFWGFIDILDGHLAAENVQRLEVALLSTDSPEVTVLRFHERLAMVLFDLDDPGNTARISREQGCDIVSLDASLYFRAEIVASGEAMYRRHVEEPVGAQGAQGAEGEALLFVADEMLPAHWEPSVSIETGSNVARWGVVTAPIDVSVSACRDAETRGGDNPRLRPTVKLSGPFSLSGHEGVSPFGFRVLIRGGSRRDVYLLATGDSQRAASRAALVLVRSRFAAASDVISIQSLSAPPVNVPSGTVLVAQGPPLAVSE